MKKAKKLHKASDEELFAEAFRRGLSGDSDISAIDWRGMEAAVDGKRLERKDFSAEAVFGNVFAMVPFDEDNGEHHQVAQVLMNIETEDFLALKSVLFEEQEQIAGWAIKQFTDYLGELKFDELKLTDLEISWLRKLQRIRHEDTTMDAKKVAMNEKFTELRLIDDGPLRVTNLGRHMLEIAQRREKPDD